MSDQTPQIQQALSKQLASLGYSTAHENTEFIQPITSYVQETFIPAPMFAAALGTDAYNRVTGVYLIDVFTPSGNGAKDANDIFVAIAAAFQRGATLTQGSTSVRILHCYRSQGRVEGDMYHLPVTVEFWSDIPPT